MADPAIRAALEAAHKARVRSRYERTKAMFAHGVDQELADSSADTAAAIVAFLRALPERFPMPGQHNPACQVWGHLKGEMRRLAAAVEEAARDA